MAEILNIKVLEKGEEDKFDTTIFRKIQKHLYVGQEVLIEDAETKEETPAEIIYVGPRFCTVRLKKGHNISVNYASMIDKNSKDIFSTTIKF